MAINLEKFRGSQELVDGDFDYRVYETVYNFPWELMSKAGFKKVYGLLRQEYPSRRSGGCGHDWDCCGCLIGVKTEITFNNKGAIVWEHHSFNY